MSDEDSNKLKESVYFLHGKEHRKTVVIPGSNTTILAKNIVDKSDDYLKLCPTDTQIFASGEVCPKILKNIRDRHVIIVTSGHGIPSPDKNGFEMTVNDIFIELMLLIQAAKLAGAKRIDVISPLFFYSRQDKKIGSRQPISAKFIADSLALYDVKRVVSVDLHASQIQGFFNCSMDNLYAIKYLADELKKYVTINSSLDFFLVAPDQGATKRVAAYSRYMNIPYVQMNKSRSRDVAHKIDYITYGGGELKEDQLKGMHAIIIDDMIDTAGSCIKCVRCLCEDYKVVTVSLAAVHGIFSDPAFDRINSENRIPVVFSTNTVCQTESKKKCAKLVVIDISELLAQVCDCLISGKSISKLFPVSE